jgi:uncharacterized membrane protein YcaP (DUF421 family)
MLELDWQELFKTSVPIAEITLRGSSVYWFLFLLFRFVMRRDVGSVGIADVLVLVIIADASQNAMAGGYTSITDGFILIGTIVSWNLLLDWLSFRFPRLGRLARPAALRSVRDGKIQYRNLRRELISDQELMSKIREQGVPSLEEVQDVQMEDDGKISVIKRNRS